MKCIQEGIDSTQNKAHSDKNTSEVTKAQLYYSLVSEMVEKPDLVHETHWANKPRQLYYVHQKSRLSEWKRYDVPLFQTEQLRNIVEETETYGSSKLQHKINENVKATKTTQQICGNRPIVSEEASRDTTKSQLDEGSEHDIFERHALNRNHILQSVEKLILQNKEFIPAIC